MPTSRTLNSPSPNDGHAAPAPRFIARDTLNSFVAWRPVDLAGGARPGVATPVPAPAPVPLPLQRARKEMPCADGAEPLAAQLQAARQGAYQDGYRDGLVALEAFKQSFAAQTAAEIGTLVQSLDHEFAGLRQDMARSLAVAATHLARQIVRTELVTTPALIAGVAQEALDTLLLSARHITLRLHPDDTPLVAQGAAEVLAARGARLVSDASLSRGSCLVESDIGRVDARIETRWRHAVACVGCDEPWAAPTPPDAGTPVQPEQPEQPEQDEA